MDEHAGGDGRFGTATWLDGIQVRSGGMKVAGARVSVPLYLTEQVRTLGTFELSAARAAVVIARPTR